MEAMANSCDSIPNCSAYRLYCFRVEFGNSGFICKSDNTGIHKHGLRTMFEPSPLRVSAMTIFGTLSEKPDLQKMFDEGEIVPYWWIGEGIIKIEVAGKRKGMCKEEILHSTIKPRKPFFNQWSIVFRLCLDPVLNVYKEVNIKLFQNGGFQMTGITSEEMAQSAIQKLILMNCANGNSKGIWPSVPTITKFCVCMMNSDYKVGKIIRRDKLYRILVETFGLRCSYEPAMYQGVNTKFFWNNTRTADSPPGICACPTPCIGNGSGYGIGNCKKITISPFRTGSVIITGGHNMTQLTDAYNFINSVIKENMKEVLRDDIDAQVATNANAKSKTKSKVQLVTTSDILFHKMRTSPRNMITL